MAHLEEPVTRQRYAHQRLYASAAGRYVTLEGLVHPVEDEEGLVVRDAATGDDITPAILQQIIIERAPHG
jgi:polyhydroxyalkanoate synthesis regulator protein